MLELPKGDGDVQISDYHLLFVENQGPFAKYSDRNALLVISEQGFGKVSFYSMNFEQKPFGFYKYDDLEINQTNSGVEKFCPKNLTSSADDNNLLLVTSQCANYMDLISPISYTTELLKFKQVDVKHNLTYELLDRFPLDSD